MNEVCAHNSMKVSVFFLHKAIRSSKYLLIIIITTTTIIIIKRLDDLQQYPVILFSSVTSWDIMFI
jgi:hypothetical protein